MSLYNYDSFNGGDGTVNNDFDGTKTLAAIGFTDVNNTGAFSTSGDEIQVNTAGGSDFSNKHLIRPVGEDSLTGIQGVEFDSFTDGRNVVLASRYQRGTANTYYMLSVGSTIADTSVYAVLGGGPHALAFTTTDILGAYASTGVIAYSIDRPNATAGTDIILIMLDKATRNVIGYFEMLGDTTVGLQSAGGRGISGYSGAYTVSRIRTAPGEKIDNKIGVDFCGNSLVRGYGPSYPGGIINPTMPEYLQSMLPSNYFVFNNGSSGASTDNLWGYVVEPDRAIASPFIDYVGGNPTHQQLRTANVRNPELSTLKMPYLEGVNSLGGVNNGSDQTVEDCYLRVVQAAKDAKAAGVDKFIVCDDPANNQNTEENRAAFNALIDGDTVNFDGLVKISLLEDANGNQITNSTAETQNTEYYQPDQIHWTPALAQIAAAAVLPKVMELSEPPTITTQPSNASEIVGATATIAIVATNATSYQAQVSTNEGSTWSNIAGATSTSYTTAALQLADSGKEIRIGAINATGTTWSNPATLTVSADPDTTPPTVSGAVLAADGVTLTITLDEATTGTTGFTAKVGGSARSATVARPDTTHLVLTLASAAYSTDTVTIAYASGNVEDTAGNALATITSAAVTNDSTQSAPSGGGVTDEDIANIAAAVLASEVEPGLTMLQALRLLIAVMAGDATVTVSSTTFKRQDGQTVALTISNDILGNRTGSTVGTV